MLARRWPLAVVAVVVALGGAVHSFTSTGPTYSFTSTVLLLPPAVDTHPAPGSPDYTRGNPLFYLGALNQARDILVATLNSRDAQEKLSRSFSSAGNEISPDIVGSSPVVIVTGKGSDKTEARGVVQYVVKELPSTLKGLQSGLGVSPSAMITSNLLTEDTVPSVSHKAQIRAALLVGGVLGALALASIRFLDIMLLGRSQRKNSKGGRGQLRGVMPAAREHEDRDDAPGRDASSTLSHMADRTRPRIGRI